MYLYKVLPINILNINDQIKNDIMEVYKQFLKEFNIEYQIIYRKKKFDIDAYIENSCNNVKETTSDNVIQEYKDKLKEKLIKENLYCGKFYIVIAIRDQDNIKINDIDNLMVRLNNIGCDISRIEGKDNIMLILYECINK